MTRRIGVQSVAFFGKNEPFKNQIEKIRDLNVDFVEVKPHYHPDIKYLGWRKGNVYFKKSCMKYVKELCQDLRFQFHFRDMINGVMKNLCTGEKDYINFLLSIAEETSHYFDDFVLTTHLMYAKRGRIEIPVEQAIANAEKSLEELYERWDFSGKLALETMMEPFVYENAALLGHNPKQLERLLEGKHDKFGICIDTGHLNKGLNNAFSFESFKHLPVYEIHFHGNHTHTGIIDDEHTIPKEETLVDYKKILKYLESYEGSINIEVQKVTDADQLKELIKILRKK